MASLPLRPHARPLRRPPRSGPVRESATTGGVGRRAPPGARSQGVRHGGSAAAGNGGSDFGLQFELRASPEVLRRMRGAGGGGAGAEEAEVGPRLSGAGVGAA